MQDGSAQIVFPPAVRAMQERLGSRAGYAKRDVTGFRREITPDLAAFLLERKSFYLATATRDGRPYIQHRGGPKGFLRPLGPTMLGFADFPGNRQYITIGNLSENPAVHLFLMDYTHHTRVKIWGRGRVVEADAELLARLSDPAYSARVERAIVIEIDAWDINCHQHIPILLDAEDASLEIRQLKARVAELESENALLRAGGKTISTRESR